MSLTADEKKKVVEAYQTKAGDTGSPQVQVALLSATISKLTGHFKTHKKDHHSRRGLLRMVNLRRKLLAYLRGKDIKAYRDLVARLKLRA